MSAHWRRPLFFFALFGVVFLAAACSDSEESGLDLSELPQLSYLDEDGALWLVNADGSDRRKLADEGVCGSRLRWSPTGETLICSGSGILLDSKGNLVGNAPGSGVRGVHWSPSGEFLLSTRLPDEVPQTVELHLADKRGVHLAQMGSWTTGVRPVPSAYLGAALWSPTTDEIFFTSEDSGDIVIYSATTGESRVVGSGHRPMAWALGGDALVVRSNEEVPPEFELFGTYEVNLLDTTTGDLTRLSLLDTYTQFWASPTGSMAAYVTKGEREDGSPGLGVVDLTTGQSVTIPGSIITYGADAIPVHFLQFSPDNEYVYWNGGDGSAYRARLDGSGLEELFELPSFFFAWAPDASMIAYTGPGPDDEEARTVLYTQDSDGGVKYEVADLGNPRYFAWRPVPR